MLLSANQGLHLMLPLSHVLWYWASSHEDPHSLDYTR